MGRVTRRVARTRVDLTSDPPRVVRRPDARWGEIPVAFVARTDASLTADALLAACKDQLAGYKKPREIVFIAYEAFPRSASGKVLRHELERLLP